MIFYYEKSKEDGRIEQNMIETKTENKIDEEKRDENRTGI